MRYFMYKKYINNYKSIIYINIIHSFHVEQNHDRRFLGKSKFRRVEQANSF